MRYSVDSLEDGIALLCGDDGSVIRIEADSLSYALHTGDILVCSADGRLVPDRDEARSRQAKAADLFARLKKAADTNKGNNA